MTAVFSPIRALTGLAVNQKISRPTAKKNITDVKKAAPTSVARKAAPVKKATKKASTAPKGALVAKKVTKAKPAKKQVVVIDAPAPIKIPTIYSDKYTGDGTPSAPLQQILNVDPNLSDCEYCPARICPCNTFTTLLADTFVQLSRKRITSTNKKQMCAKSILPPFVSRLVDVLSITKDDTFYDLGCGNGSVLFQIAYMTGAKCVGVELSEHNAQLAREAWEIIRPQLEKSSGRKMPEVEIISGDLTAVIAQPQFLSRNTVVWTANLLMPKMLTQHMAERFRCLPVGSRIACFDDMFPHSRSIARIRDPEAFELFEMVDHTWAPSSVEWTFYEGPFYSYIRK